MNDTVLVRYGEIGTKSYPVRGKMEEVLRQRCQDRLRHDKIEFESVRKFDSRIVITTSEPEEAAKALSEMPGVASASPAVEIEADIEEMKTASKDFKIKSTFGVDTNRVGDHDFTSHDVNREVGAEVEERTGSKVDLDNPETRLEIDIRYDQAYMFTERFEGPDGYPVGAAGSLAALISGGIDSPVAAYKVMTRGADILPIYFYNKPIAAEDHVLRFKSAVSKLVKYNPSKKWEVYIVDMDEINQELMKVERGRMVLHRQLMFRVAEELAKREGLDGLVTGESMSQKSSQTTSNLAKTSSEVELPILRPLITYSKKEIVENAKQINTFEDATINSACSSLSPSNPATQLKTEKVEELKDKVGFEKLVEKAVENAEKSEI